MALSLYKFEIYANPYTTNWNYLQNMTSLQVKALEEMEWDGEYIRDSLGLWFIPWAWIEEKSTKNSVEDFMERLNNKIKRL